jgi:hypothetical protein
MTAPNVIKQAWYSRADAQNNLGKAVYMFGDNCKRKGCGGQAKEIRDEPNAIGIATKNTPTSGSNSYFSDDDFLANCRVIAQDFRAAFQARDDGLIVIFPTDGLGTGLSELPTRAPRTNEFLDEIVGMLFSGGQPAWKQILND